MKPWQPCPFCSRTTLEYLDIQGDTNALQVHCLNCHATGPQATTDRRALTLWNRALRGQLPRPVGAPPFSHNRPAIWARRLTTLRPGDSFTVETDDQRRSVLKSAQNLRLTVTTLKINGEGYRITRPASSSPSLPSVTSCSP